MNAPRMSHMCKVLQSTEVKKTINSFVFMTSDINLHDLVSISITKQIR